MKRFSAFRQTFRPRAVAVALLLAVVGAGACSSPPPYVHRSGEFNRAAVDFGREPVDADSIIVCYGRMGTTPAQVVAVARAECARYGKVPRFDHQGILICPLVTPISAHYDCIVPAPGK